MVLSLKTQEIYGYIMELIGMMLDKLKVLKDIREFRVHKGYKVHKVVKVP